MDRAGKQEGSSYSPPSSSSFTADLFGPKDSSKSSSFGLFGSIFGPPIPTVPGRDISGICHKCSKTKQGNYTINKDTENRKVEPCYFNSSIYYGGQEVYSSTTQNTVGTPPNFKEDGRDIDQNESNSSCASRGNWWQGSLYY
ncbi:hypothetical protein CDL12_16626 [Handroanthus impetiginosus]|uniref:Uncharacterized protein n=1 Tax=Handroanthus impetiginosus TaxID=429701 RepID=A0A2G9GZS4_9LAMI|nr:hypothetical protein CDL12_16626 [Handroanthus impetiginosus]